MTRADKKTLFTALAFVTFVLKSDEVTGQAWRIRQLATLIENFCDEPADDTSKTLALVDGTAAEAIDLRIKRHIEELRNREATRLPEDKQTLLMFYDRLQHRKTRRMQREFYASVREDELADLVLQLLDDEIEHDPELM